LEEILRALSPRHRKVLIQRELYGWSYWQIARDHRITRDAADKLLARARKSAKACLQELLDRGAKPTNVRSEPDTLHAGVDARHSRDGSQTSKRIAGRPSPPKVTQT
jgi:hypothetical protein